MSEILDDTPTAVVSPRLCSDRATLAALIRHRGRDHPSVLAASTQFAVDRVAERILGLGARFPEITAEQAVQLHRAVAEIVGRPGGGGPVGGQ